MAQDDPDCFQPGVGPGDMGVRTPISEIRMVSIARAAEFEQLEAERLDLS